MLPRENLAWALLAFNAGAKLGQMAVILVLLPALLWLRSRLWEPRAARALSAGVPVIGAYWLIARVF